TLKYQTLFRSLTFKVLNRYGLSNIITSSASTVNISEMIDKTAVENLDVLTSGPTPPNPAELLGSERLSQLLDFLREKYDFIILDAPPVDTVDRKSTRLNSSHVSISYAVFCLKKKKIICEYHKNN